MSVTVDARGQRCPWPLVRLARAMRETPGPVTLLADDPQVAVDLPALAAERGWQVGPMRCGSVIVQAPALSLRLPAGG